MATITPTELAIRVLENLNFLRPGKDPDQAQVAKIIARWSSIYAEMVEDGTAAFDRDRIPEQVLEPVGWYVAVAVAPTFGALPIVLQAVGAPNAEAALMPLRRRIRRYRHEHFNYERAKVIPF